MVLDVLPVIPPDLRPLVPLEGGRFATSDLNDLYRRVINRNNRLKNLLQLKTPEVIIRNEKRMLQEAVDALFDNGRHGRAVTGAGNRPLKSLSDMLKGKGGRFRQNLLGKRVDYSGRSVIVIGPELKLHQCGLPKKMALVLFEPFIIRRLKELGYVHTVRSAKKMIERQTPEVWDILEEVTKGHPVLLNRAPTLHRLSIQAFEPLLIEGEAIRIHPLVCTAYNADFDGDQMAVHVPLSVEAQMEARLLMMAPNNIFSPSSGKPITTPSQDITLGCYYLTAESAARDRHGRPKRAAAVRLARPKSMFAMADGAVKTHDRIRLQNPDFGQETDLRRLRPRRVIETTVGRVIFNEIWPDELGFFNKAAGKKQLSDIIWRCYQVAGHESTVETLDQLKELGFREATKAGVSIGIDDMIIPKEKETRNSRTPTSRSRSREAVSQGHHHRRRALQQDHRHLDPRQRPDLERHVPARSSTTRASKEFNPVYLMVDSGARGNRQQVRQLAGMRGLMAKPSRRNHRAADSLELPRRPDRARILHLHARRAQRSGRHRAQDRRLRLHDPQAGGRVAGRDHPRDRLRHRATASGAGRFTKATTKSSNSATRIVGRVQLRRHRRSGRPKKKIVKANQLIDEIKAKAIENVGVEKLKIRSVLTCESKRGVCAQLLRPQPGDRPAGQARRSGRHHRRAIHRRARHAADDAHVPHRRHGEPDVQAAASSRRRTTARCVTTNSASCNARRQLDRAEQERLDHRAQRRRPRTRALQRRHRLGHLRRRRRPGEEGRNLRAMGSVQRADSDREGRQDRIPRHDRGRDDEAAKSTKRPA